MTPCASLFALWLFGAAFFAAFSTPIRTAEAATVRTEVSGREARVGEEVRVRLVVTVDDGEEAPAPPQLTVRGRALVHGPTRSTQSRISMHNFSVTREQSVTFTWTVVPEATGTLLIGPVPIAVGNQKLRSESVEVRVVDGPPRDSGRARSRRLFDPFSNDPFDPFGGGFPFPGHPPTIPPAPEHLNLDRAPHPTAFLHVQLDKTKVVVGEPVRLRIYAYGSLGPFGETNPTEPSTADFLSFVVVEGGHEQQPYLARVGDEDFHVLELRELVLVPLKTGRLTIGAMRAVLQGRGYPKTAGNLGFVVEGPTSTIEVVEPPAKGRPEGYLLGDVGSYRLEAELEPTRIDQGEYAEVRVRIVGEGNLPTRVRLPQAAGLEWQDPTSSGGPRIENGQLGGTRSLKIPLRATRAGSFDLGEVTLPFWDPSAQSYRVARAALGTLDVRARDDVALATTPSPSTPDATSAAKNRVEIRARKEPSSFVAERDRTPPAWLSWALFVVPGLALGARCLGWLIPRLRHRLVKDGAGTSARTALEEARRALAAGDARATSRHLERAIYGALEEEFGLRVRAVLRAELGSRLASSGVPNDVAHAVGELALELENSRYGKDDVDAASLVRRTESVVAELRKAKKSSARSKGASS